MKPTTGTVSAALICLCAAAMVPAAWAAESPREVAMRGMRMIAEEGASEQRQYDGWQLVARGIGEMLLAEGLWDAGDEQLQAAITEFMVSCADEAQFPEWRAPTAHDTDQTDFGSPIIVREPRAQTRRGADGDLLALLIHVTHSEAWGPHFGDFHKLLIARNAERMVTGAWQQYVGRSSTDPAIYGTAWERWGAWHADGQVRALFAGGWVNGGSGGSRFPVGALVESAGDHWCLLDWAGPDPPSGYQAYERALEHPYSRFNKGFARVDDVNGDGVPEVVGAYQFGKYGMGGTAHYPARDYFVYKVIGDELRKVWYAKAESPRAVVLRFVEAIEFDCQPMALNVCSSPDVVAQAERLGLFSLEGTLGSIVDHWSLALNRGSRFVSITLADQSYRFDLTPVSDQRWRISGIERAEQTP